MDILGIINQQELQHLVYYLKGLGTLPSSLAGIVSKLELALVRPSSKYMQIERC